MQPPQKRSWIDIAEMKDQLTKNIGPERSHQYFDYLKRFLSLKLSKNEFDKLCLRTIGKDNISLHNQLIRSILKNAVGNKKVCNENGSVPVVNSKNNKLQKTEFLGRITEKEVSTRTSLHAPLGIPHWPVNGSRKVSSFASNNKRVGLLDTCSLIDSIKLKERMEQITATQGLKGVTMDSASVLNNGLDAYLKGLIRSFTKPMNNSFIKKQADIRPLNGFRSDFYNQIQSRVQKQEPKRSVSLLDVTAAMELDPLQLGEDWPILLEKICTLGFEK